jgi:hypothetical protein
LTTPRDRVSFGFHAFPFYGMARPERPLYSVPLLPIRVRPPGGPWSNPLNAVMDTGSTHSYLPGDMAGELGLAPAGTEVERKGSGATFAAQAARCDLAIVDAGFPTVTCWELSDFELWVPTKRASLEVPLLGWDLLHLFDLSLSSHEDLIRMRLAPAPAASRR